MKRELEQHLEDPGFRGRWAEQQQPGVLEDSGGGGRNNGTPEILCVTLVYASEPFIISYHLFPRSIPVKPAA